MLKVVTVAVTVLLSAVMQGAFAQAFPNRPITLVAPFSVGGALDLIARGVGQQLSEKLGQSVVVDNRAGASGAIGSMLVAKAAPDGYTLLLGATTTHGINPVLNTKVGYNPVKDFTPISMVATIPHVLVINPSVPANSLKEFVQLAKSKPGMTYGSAGIGSPHHLAGAMLGQMAGIDVVHVPYKGSGPAMTDLIGGQLQFMSVELAAAEPHIKAGKLKPLAIAAPKRIPGIELPTIAESGYPGFEVTAWYAVFGPAGMSEDVVSRLSGAIAKGLESPDLRGRLEKLGAKPVASTSAELAAHVRSELDRWTRVVKTANIQIE